MIKNKFGIFIAGVAVLMIASAGYSLVSWDWSNAFNLVTSAAKSSHGTSGENITSVSVMPNPAKTNLAIHLRLPHENGKFRLRIFNTAGKMIRSFKVDQSSDVQTFSWNVTDNSGNALASGVYFARLSWKSQVINHKFVIIR
jgi:flagellar hook assembly protein FlgD